MRPWCLLTQDIATSSKECSLADKEPRQPARRTYSVIRREGQDDFWLPIGAAFAHQDGDGYNIVLQALPIDGRVVLRVPKDDERPDQPTERGPASRFRRK